MNDALEGSHGSFKHLIDAPELRALCRPVRWRVVRDLLLIWAQIAVAAALYLAHPAWWTWGAAFVLMAGGQHGLALATHEFAHGSLFPDHRRVSEFCGTWLFGAPAGVPFAIFRHRHFAHHRTYSTAEDSKVVYRRSVRGWRLVLEIVAGVSGYELTQHVRVAHARHAGEAVAGVAVPSLRDALCSLVIVQGAIALVCVWLGGVWFYTTLWLLPLLTLAQLFQTFRAIVEHRPLEAQMGVSPASGYYGDTPGPFVRTVRASWWERLVLCKFNFGFHAEHHLWPQVSYQYLPALHERLERAGAFGDPRFGNEDTYVAAIRKLWRPAAGARATR